MIHHSYWGILVGMLVAGPASAASPITAAVFSPDAKQVLLGSQEGVEVRSWPDLKVASRLEVQLSHVHDLAFSPDGKVLLAAGGSPAEEGAVEVLSWPDGMRVRRVAGYKDLVYRVAWSSNGMRWAAASADGTCRVYAADSATHRVRYEGHSRAVLAVAFLPDGKTAISAGVDQTLQLWDVETGKQIRIMDSHVAAVNDLSVRPKTAVDALPIIASVSEDRTVRLWQPTIGRLMRFVRLPSPPRVVLWSPNGDRLLVGCNDGMLRVFDPDTLTLLVEKRALPGRIHSLAVGAEHHETLVAGDSGPVRVAW